MSEHNNERNESSRWDGKQNNHGRERCHPHEHNCDQCEWMLIQEPSRKRVPFYGVIETSVPVGRGLPGQRETQVAKAQNERPAAQRRSD